MSREIKIEVSADHNPAATPIDGQYIVSFIRKQLRADEVYPSDLRYNDTTGNVEYSPDGGATWVPAPGSDPRQQTRLPPQTGVNADCNSAASAVEWLKRYVTIVTTLLDAGAALVYAVTTIVSAFEVIAESYGLLWDLIAGVFSTLQAAGAAAITAAMTGAVYDELTCIINCNLNASNQVTVGSFATIQSDVTSQIGGLAATLINGMFSVMGWGGLNDIMALALATDDCSDCGCGWCHTFDFTISSQGWSAITPPVQASYVTSEGWVANDFKHPTASTWYRAAYITILFPATEITSISYSFHYTVGAIGANVWWLMADSTGAFIQSTGGTPPSGDKTEGWTGVRTMDRLNLLARCSVQGSASYSGGATIYRCTIRGNGTNPFGENNC